MQTSQHLFMVRPVAFGFNEQTAVSNEHQKQLSVSSEEVQRKAVEEFDEYVRQLKSFGISVWVFEDTLEPIKPDSIFPNNWVSFHRDGTIILYPMLTPNRRVERRMDVLENLGKHFAVKNIIDLSSHEQENQFLEGTGSIVFDHTHKIAYACLSPRTDKNLLLKLSETIGYKAVCFSAYEKSGQAVYHTNVMLSVGKDFAIACLESVTDAEERKTLIKSLTDTDHEIIDITEQQMNSFAGNALQVHSDCQEAVLVISETGWNSLTVAQKTLLESKTKILPIRIPTIETVGGGSARCMIAEVFLPEKG